MSTGDSLADIENAVDAGGEVAAETTAQVQAAFGNQTVTANAPFSCVFNGGIVAMHAGQTIEAGPDLLAALVAAGAPITTP